MFKHYHKYELIEIVFYNMLTKFSCLENNLFYYENLLYFFYFTIKIKF